MQTCSYCGANLPENTRFCGTCGSVQDAIATDAATRSNTPPPQSRASQGGTPPATWSQPDSNYLTQGSAPTWSANVQASAIPPPPPVAENEDEDERRRGLLPWPPLYDAPLGGNALIGNGQASTPGMPVVHGTPIGNMPTVAGSSIPNPNVPNPVKPASHLNPNPVTHPASHLNSNPVTHPISHPAPKPVTHPVSHPTPNPITHPINHPAPKPVTHPVSHPAPNPITHPGHHKPEPPGTQEHHKHHEHHTHHTQHTVEHVAKVTKVAGGSTAKTILLVVVAAVVVGAAGIVAATHFLLRPQPLISMTSSYKVGNALAGANGTILHISGQNFSSNSAITFLLDGSVAPGNPGTQSDSNGNFSADVTVTNAWSVGTHTLTAKDASNNSTKNSVSVTVVQPGQANTPGPTPTPIPPTPTTPPATLTSGTWQGQGQGRCFNASCQFDMTISITVNGNSISGTLTENVYNTTVNVVGTTNGDTFSFTGTSYVSGNQIQLGCVYSGTVSNGSISGQWVYPNPQDGGGAYSLKLMS